MGRYAYFSTGLEYKFWFAIQASDDIQKFGGVELHSNDGYSYHAWHDAEETLQKIKSLHLMEEKKLVSFLEEFSESLGGSEHLYNFYYEWINDMKLHGEDSACLLLGCLIWHQLLYSSSLYVRYES